MNRRWLSRVLLLLLAALLLSPPAFAVGGRTLEREPGLLAALWQFFESLVPVLEEGVGTLDPNGTPATSGTEGRGTIDPNGATASGTEGVGTIDPDG